MIRKISVENRSILDVGCGSGNFGYALRSRGIQIKYLVGCDVRRDMLYCAKNFYDDVVLCDVRYIPFRDFSFHIVVSIQVLEHLSRPEGIRLLDSLESMSKKLVIVSTTNGYISAPHDPSGRNFMAHRSFWSPTDFYSRGYKVYGEVGPRVLPLVLAYWVSFLLPLTWLLPSKAWYLMCIKFKG